LNFESLINANSHLFWWVPESRKKDIPLESLVEAVLNYGDAEGVKGLFEVYGVKKISEIFYRQITKERSNYLPQVKHYFSLYFSRHV